MFTMMLFGNSPRAIAVAAAIAASIVVIAAALRAFARSRAQKARGTATQVDDFLVDVVMRTKLLLLLVPAVHAGMRALTLPPEVSRIIGLLSRLSLIAQAAIWTIAVTGFALDRYGRTRVETEPAAVTTLHAFRIGAVVSIWVIAILVALDNAGFNVTALITGLGIGGVAVALAAQNILGDLFASLSIVVDKPFVVGDFIAVGDDLGEVRHIGLKTTRIRSLSGEELVIGNGDLLKSRIRNYKRMAERRVLFRIGVVYQTSREVLEHIPQIVRAAIESQTPVRFERGHFADLGESAYEFEFVYFVGSRDYQVFMEVHQAVNLAIVREFEAVGIEFAYPTRTIHGRVLDWS